MQFLFRLISVALEDFTKAADPNGSKEMIFKIPLKKSIS